MHISRYIFFLYVLISGGLLSCHTRYYFTVYDENLKQTKIDIQDTNRVYIINNAIACKPCVNELVKKLKGKEIVIVSMVDKNKFAIKSYMIELGIEDTSNVEFRFQFKSQNDPYEPSRKNKLFQVYSFNQSPFVLVPTKDSVQIVFPDYNKSIVGDSL